MDYLGMLTFIKDGKKDREFYKDSDEKNNKVIESIYRKADQKVTEGYTVVTNIKGTVPNENNIYGFSQSEILVPEKIKNQDYILIMDEVKKDFQTIKIMDIINYCNRNGYLDYDYYDYNLNVFELREEMDSIERYYRQRDNESRTPDKILDLFLRKKLEGLTTKEEKMYQIYEDFNIERILYEDNTKYSLNNGNSGVITIFPDATYQSTVTKMSHMSEHKHHLDVYMKSKGILEQPDNIYLQLTNNYVACWIPPKMNEYQNNKLHEFLTELEDIQMLRGQIEVFGAIRKGDGLSDIKEEFQEIEQIKEHITKENLKK